MVATTPIACGIAGWSYPDWQGYVYPPGVRDALHYVAAYVDCIEINSTFYHPPDARRAASWAERTEDYPNFFFTAKLHQDVTHRGRIDPDMVRSFRSGLEPLCSRGKLRHLLAQFRYDFADSTEARAHLERIRSGFSNIANLTLELRHNSWQSPSAMAFLKETGATVANLDYPTARDSFNLRACRLGRHAYLRLHGRNAKAWFDKKAGRDETYNYLYSPAEIREIRSRALDLASMTKSLTLVANNHYRGKELVNAIQLKALIAEEKVGVPPPLLEKYPQLREIATGE